MVVQGQLGEYDEVFHTGQTDSMGTSYSKEETKYEFGCP